MDSIEELLQIDIHYPPTSASFEMLRGLRDGRMTAAPGPKCRFAASWVHELGDFCRVMGPPVT